MKRTNLQFRTIGFESKQLRQVENLYINGHRGISGKVRYLVALALKQLKKKTR